MTETPMTCDRVDAALAAYLEDELPLAARRAVEVHLGECVRCAGLVRDIEAIRRDAANLPELEPSRDLWAGIAARIEAPVLKLERPAEQRSRHRPWWLAAAAAGLVAVTAGITYTLTMQRAGLGTEAAPLVATTGSPDSAGVFAVDSPAVPQARVATNPEASAPTSAPAPGSQGATNVANTAPVTGEVTLSREIVELRRILDERQLVLDSATVAVLEHSLATIDRAITEARTALERDPASPFLNDQLNRALEKKLGLLRTVALLPSRM